MQFYMNTGFSLSGNMRHILGLYQSSLFLNYAWVITHGTRSFVKVPFNSCTCCRWSGSDFCSLQRLLRTTSTVLFQSPILSHFSRGSRPKTILNEKKHPSVDNHKFFICANVYKCSRSTAKIERGKAGLSNTGLKKDISLLRSNGEEEF